MYTLKTKIPNKFKWQDRCLLHVGLTVYIIACTLISFFQGNVLITMSVINLRTLLIYVIIWNGINPSPKPESNNKHVLTTNFMLLKGILQLFSNDDKILYKTLNPKFSLFLCSSPFECSNPKNSEFHKPLQSRKRSLCLFAKEINTSLI